MCGCQARVGVGASPRANAGQRMHPRTSWSSYCDPSQDAFENGANEFGATLSIDLLGLLPPILRGARCACQSVGSRGAHRGVGACGIGTGVAAAGERAQVLRREA